MRCDYWKELKRLVKRAEKASGGNSAAEYRVAYVLMQQYVNSHSPSPERADARIAELERECAQWRDELRIYRETENKRIAELERSVTVRDTEIARLETDLELGRHTLMLESERMQGEINRAAKTHESEMELLAESGEVVADAARYLAIDPRGQEAELARLTALVEAIARAGNGGGV